MYNRDSTVPVVMSFSATDPTGGGGIQADIEALCSMGCHCAPIITAITAQDTTDLSQYYPCPCRLVRDQARAVLEDISISGFKIGALGSIENVRAVHQLLNDYPDIPVVLDPVLQIGPKAKLIDHAQLEAIIALILPFVTVCTPNAAEARLMAPEADTLDACAQEIMAHGAGYVLVTGAHQIANKVTNTFYGNYRRLEVFHWDRLENNYQGSGCTLSASIAGLLAQGLSPASAIRQAQEYTLECLKSGFRIGMGQHLPNRLFWARENSFEYDVHQQKQEKSS
jgi:hydroxymethylpyrimidine/phosphomethylpyrimidine kinase